MCGCRSSSAPRISGCLCRPRVWFLLVRVDAAIDDAAGMASLVQEVWPSLVQVSKAREDRLENYLA